MDKELQVVPQQLPQQAQPTPVSLTQTGNDNTQIAHVEHYEQSVVIIQGNRRSRKPMLGQGVAYNYDCFNFFVIGDEAYEDEFFIVPKNKALTESTPRDIQDQCASLSPAAISVIRTFPSLFCSKNRHFSKTDPDHMAAFGYVTDIEVQDDGIKVFFQAFNTIQQQKLIELSQELCIDGAKSYTELCQTHWAIKRVNLIEILENAGFRVVKL